MSWQSLAQQGHSERPAERYLLRPQRDNETSSLAWRFVVTCTSTEIVKCFTRTAVFVRTNMCAHSQLHKHTHTTICFMGVVTTTRCGPNCALSATTRIRRRLSYVIDATSCRHGDDVLCVYTQPNERDYLFGAVMGCRNTNKQHGIFAYMGLCRTESVCVGVWFMHRPNSTNYYHTYYVDFAVRWCSTESLYVMQKLYDAIVHESICDYAYFSTWCGVHSRPIIAQRSIAPSANTQTHVTVIPNDNGHHKSHLPSQSDAMIPITTMANFACHCTIEQCFGNNIGSAVWCSGVGRSGRKVSFRNCYANNHRWLIHICIFRYTMNMGL